VIFSYTVAELQILWGIDVQELRAHPDDEELADFFFERKLAQGSLRPSFSLAIEVNGTRLPIFFFAERRADEGAEEHTQ
jgi:hypothetical protein